MNNIETILNDLYRLDPALKEHESVLRPLIAKLIEIKPDITVDQGFVNTLRAQVINQAHQMESEGLKPSADRSARPYYVYGTLAVAMIAIVGFSYFNFNSSVKFESSIKDVSDSAFGPLAGVDPSRSARPQSGGGGGFGGDMAFGGGGGGIASAPAMSEDGTSVDAKMIAPVPPYEVTQVVYKYAGDEFSQDDATVPVYKRVVDDSVISSLNRSISRMGLGLVDLSRAKDPLITDINISEQAEYGFNISISLREGWISFYQNWEKWPQIASTPCYDELSCQRQYYVEESQVPADNAIIAIADAFIDQYGINKSSYGAGEISKSWRGSTMYNPRALNGSVMVAPEVTVVYPLMIDGKKVYDEWGMQMGINVGVNIKNNKVSSAGNIGVQNYERSNYKAETDVKKIIALAEKGGYPETYYYETPTKTVTVNLGTPTVELVQIYSFKDGTGRGELLYVPALVFPVRNISDPKNFYRETVAIPLASELIDQRMKPIPVDGGPIQIMPMEKAVPPAIDAVPPLPGAEGGSGSSFPASN